MDAARHAAGHGFGTEEGQVALSGKETKLSYSYLLTEAAVARLVELVRSAQAGASLQALQRGEAVEQLAAHLRERFRGAHLAREVLSSALVALRPPADASAVEIARSLVQARATYLFFRGAALERLRRPDIELIVEGFARFLELADEKTRAACLGLYLELVLQVESDYPDEAEGKFHRVLSEKFRAGTDGDEQLCYLERCVAVGIFSANPKAAGVRLRWFRENVDPMRRAPRLEERLEALSGFVGAGDVRPILELLRSPLIAAP